MGVEYDKNKLHAILKINILKRKHISLEHNQKIKLTQNSTVSKSMECCTLGDIFTL